MNAVRGNGNTVTTMCAARKASGNHGPTDVAQSRSCTAVGQRHQQRDCDENHNRDRDRDDPAAGDLRSRRDHRSCAARRRVLTTDFTATKTTGRPVIRLASCRIASRLPGARWPDGDHLA